MGTRILASLAKKWMLLGFGFISFAIGTPACILGESCREDSSCSAAHLCVRGHCVAFSGEVYLTVNLPPGKEALIHKVRVTLESLSLPSSRVAFLQKQGDRWVAHLRQLRAGVPLLLRIEVLNPQNKVIFTKEVREIRPTRTTPYPLTMTVSEQQLVRQPTVFPLIREFISTDSVVILDSTADEQGNIYTTGHFQSNLTVGDTTYPSNGKQDAFIVSLTPKGDIRFTLTFGGSEDDWGRGIQVDAKGFVYIVAPFRSPNMQIAGHTFTNATTPRASTLLLKLHPKGSVVWVRGIHGQGDQSAEAITLDAKGNIYIAGYSIGTMTAAPGRTFSQPQEKQSAFVLSYASDGSFLWGHLYGGAGLSFFSSITFDGEKHLYVSGEFTTNWTTGVPLALRSTGKKDLIVGNLDLTGKPLWFQSAGSPSWDERVTSLRWSPTQKTLYMTGSFGGAAVFGQTTVQSKGDLDAFTASLSPTGQWLWVRTVGGEYEDTGQAFFEGDDYAYFVGCFKQKLTLGSWTLTHSLRSLWLAVYDAEGQPVSLSQPQGFTLFCSTSSFRNHQGELYLSVSYQGTGEVDGMQLSTQSSNNAALLWRIKLPR